MFHTVMGAQVRTMFDEHESPEWRFVYHSLNCEWFYITKIEWEDGEPTGVYMMLIGDVAELQLLLSAKLKATTIGNIYLVTPGHMNGTGHWNHNLLLKIDEVDDVYPGCANINHIYTIHRNGPTELYSSLPDGEWEKNERVVLYDAGPDVLKVVESEMDEQSKRLASIMLASARLHKNDASASNLWLLTPNLEFGGRRPIDMTNAVDYDWVQSHISKSDS
ncbi:hypothetical protein WLF18_02410 [Pseudomonas shirazensis]|uniref:Uncharacterized protein n=1 Tax=Pseudomonas shirazensis TaxID=2745494 RepID=A0ABU8ZVW6_9PSED